MERTRKILLIVVTAILLVVAVVAALIYWQLNQDTTELSTVTGDLAFMTDREGHWDIVIRDPDGNVTNLTAGEDSHEYFFNFTFSGDVVNFYSTRNGGSNPAIVNADGSDFKVMNYLTAMAQVVQSGNTDMDPAWSPDGERVVWTTVRGLGVKLYLADAAFEDERELSGSGTTNNMMAWSPDGSRVVFTSDREDRENDVFMVDIESGDVTQLTDEGYDVQPVWSLDGEQILFISEREVELSTGEFEFYIMNADGSDLRPFGPDEVFTGDPTYSPDGEQVAYMSNESGYWHIYVMDADGEGVRQITEGESNNLFPAWRPIPAEDVPASETDADDAG